MNSTATRLFGGALFAAGLTYGEENEPDDGHSRTKRGLRGVAAAIVATSSLILVSPAIADIIHVPDDFPTIQGAINASMGGDAIIVAPGTYQELINFLGKSITVRSSDGRDVTMIDGVGLGTVVTCASDEERETVLDGFTVLGGYASLGGGMYIFLSSPTVVNCTFRENMAYTQGGGMFIRKGSPWIDACVFQGNETVGDGNGGGMAIVQTPGGGGGPPIVIRCSFIGNYAAGGKPAAHGGGGIYNDNSSPVIVSCAFNENLTDRDGAAIRNVSSAPTIIGCSFFGNVAYDFAGGIMNHSGSVYVSNCTFADNDAFLGGAIANYGEAAVVNSVFWSNTAVLKDNFIGPYPVIVTFSNIEGGWAGEGNIDADPMFIDAQNGDLRLTAGSPCIDAGDNTAVPPDEFDLDEDGDTDEALPFDLDGNPRFVDDPNTKDTGNGKPPMVDMGAYEFQVASPCPWDLNDDDLVGTTDLLLLLGSWGDPYDTADLIELLGNWGPCPK